MIDRRHDEDGRSGISESWLELEAEYVCIELAKHRGVERRYLQKSVGGEPLVLQNPLQGVANRVALLAPSDAIEFFATAAQCFHFVCSHKVRIHPHLDIMASDI